MKNGKWNRFRILCRLREEGYNLLQVSQKYGVSYHSVRHIWNRPNIGVEKAISDILGVPPSELFPDRYQRTVFTSSSRSAATDASQKSPGKPAPHRNAA